MRNRRLIFIFIPVICAVLAAAGVFGMRFYTDARGEEQIQAALMPLLAAEAEQRAADRQEKELEQERLAEAAIEQCRDGGYDGFLLSMFPIDYFDMEQLYAGRLERVLKLEEVISGYEEAVSILSEVLEQCPELKVIYIGMNLGKAENVYPFTGMEQDGIGGAASWLRTDLVWNKSLKALIDAYPDTRFEIMLPFPGAEGLLAMQEEERISLLNWMEAVGTALSGYGSVGQVHMFMPGAEEWLILNADNYTDAYNTNYGMANKLMQQMFWDYNYAVTPDTIGEKINTLKGIVYHTEDIWTPIDQSEYTYVFFADSVFGNYVLTDSITGVLANFTNALVINCGFGGLSAARGAEDGKGVSSVIDALITKDTSAVSNEVCRSGIEQFLAEATHIDENKLVFFLDFGLNDYMSGCTLESSVEADISTYKGALEYAVKMLREAYPSCEVVLITPNFLGMYNNGTDEHNGYVFTDYVNTVVSLSEELDTKLIDVYREAGIDADNMDRYLADQCHPNEAGRYRIARVIFEHLAAWW